MPSNCDGRYPRYLLKPEPTEPQTRIVIADAIGDCEQPDPKRPELIESMTGWHLIDMIRHDDTLNYHAVLSGMEQQSYWEYLANLCSHPGNTWIVSYQCTRIWTLLGLWGCLESGRCRISGGDTRAVSDPLGRGSTITPGILIAEDPPCIAQIRVGTQPGLLTWIDCRNWGIEVHHLIARGQNVCNCLAELVRKMDAICHSVPLAPLAVTAASHAYRSWRTHHMPIAVHNHVHPAALELESQGHVGGRCECFRIGRVDGKIYHLDIRSCYGHIMQTAILPARLLDYGTGERAEGMLNKSNASRTLAKVTLRTSVPAYPYHHDGDTIYPVGTFTTVLAGPELRRAFYDGAILRVHAAANYTCSHILRDYAKAVYDIRVAADKECRLHISSWAKYLLNAIVGKVAQRVRRWEVVIGGRAPEPWGEWEHMLPDGSLERWRSLAGVVQREIEGGYGPDAVPAIAAWICSAARVRLLELIEIAGWDNVYYCDTDSLLCSARGYYHLNAAGEIQTGRLGKLEVRSVSNTLEIRGIKYYLEDDDVTCAGIQRGIVVRSPCGLGQWVVPPGSAGAKLCRETGRTRKLVKWPRPAPYRHGIVGSDGRVTPHTIEE